MELLEITASDIKAGSTGKLVVLPSKNGRSYMPAEEPYPVDIGDEQVIYKCAIYARSFLLACIGSFELNSLVVKVNIARL